MAVTMTSIRLDTNLADEAAKVLGVKSRTEAVHVALREIVALKRFKNLMRKHPGRLLFGEKVRDLHFDLLIALTARSHGARLITSNRPDFEMIRSHCQFKLEIWPA